MMKEIWFDSVAQKRQHTKQLCVVALLFSLAASGQSAAKCWFRLANRFRLGRPANCDKVFWTRYFRPSCLRVPVCLPPCRGSHSRLLEERDCGDERKALIVQRAQRRVSRREPCSLAIFQAQHAQPQRRGAPLISWPCTTWPCGRRKKETDRHKVCGECFPPWCPTAAGASEGIRGEVLLLAFLMWRRRPFSSAKINIWPLVVPLCLIRGHPAFTSRSWLTQKTLSRATAGLSNSALPHHGYFWLRCWSDIETIC